MYREKPVYMRAVPLSFLLTPMSEVPKPYPATPESNGKQKEKETIKKEKSQ